MRKNRIVIFCCWFVILIMVAGCYEEQLVQVDLPIITETPILTPVIELAATPAFVPTESPIALVVTPTLKFSSDEEYWARVYRSSAGDTIIPVGIEETKDGGYFIAGYTYSYRPKMDDADRVYEFTDVWVLRLNSEGTVAWQKSYILNHHEILRSIKKTSDGGFILGGVYFEAGGQWSGRQVLRKDYSGIWAIKLNEHGTIEWQKTYGPMRMNNDIASIRETPGGYYIFEGGTVGGLLKLDQDGRIISRIHLPAFIVPDYGYVFQDSLTDVEAPRSIQTVGDGSYNLTYSENHNCNIEILKLTDNATVGLKKSNKIGTYDNCIKKSYIQETGQGKYLVLGIDGSETRMLMLNEKGSVDWQRRYQISLADSFQATNDGGSIVVGSGKFNNPDRDGWILKLNSDGMITWFKVYGGANDDRFDFIQQTELGGYIVVGKTKSFGPGGSNNLWIFKLDSFGDVRDCPIIHKSNVPLESSLVTDTEDVQTDYHELTPSDYVKGENANFSSEDISFVIDVICN